MTTQLDSFAITKVSVRFFYATAATMRVSSAREDGLEKSCSSTRECRCLYSLLKTPWHKLCGSIGSTNNALEGITA